MTYDPAFDDSGERQRAVMRREGLRAGELVISALAEHTRAVLVGRGWEAEGFWRWETHFSRASVAHQQPRESTSRKVYYVWGYWRRTGGGLEWVPLPATMRPNLIRAAEDMPHAFRPLNPLARGRGIEKPAPIEDPPHGLDGDLRAFEDRMLLALRVDDALPDSERGWLKVRAYGLETCAGPGDVAPEQITRFRPSRAQIDDAEAVMAAIATLPKGDIQRLRARARGVSIRSLAERERVSAERITKEIRRSVKACCRAYTARQRAGARSAGGAGRARHGRDRGAE